MKGSIDWRKSVDWRRITSGRELGIIALTDIARQFYYEKSGSQGKAPKPTIPADRYGAIFSKLGRIPGEMEAYRQYSQVQNWIKVQYNIAQTMFQQFQVQCRVLDNFAARALLTEDACRGISKLPAIMTREQYNREWGFEELVLYATKQLLLQLMEDGRRRNPLKGIRNKYQKIQMDNGGSKWGQIKNGLLFTGELSLAECPELVDAVITDIRSKYSKDFGLVNPKKAKPEDFDSFSFSEGMLTMMDYYGLADEYDPLFARPKHNGIAVIEGSGTYPSNPDIASLYSENTLSLFFSDSESYDNYCHMVDNARTRTAFSYYYLQGYNKALDLISKGYDLQFLKPYIIDLPMLARTVDAYNSKLPQLREVVEGTTYASDDYKARKIEVLDIFFKPIDLEPLVTPQENIEQAEQMIRDGTAFTTEQNQNTFTFLLGNASQELLATYR